MGTIYFDTETTGFNPGQICELSYILEDSESVTAGNYFFTVNSMQDGAQDVHGFSIERLQELSGGKTFRDHYEEINRLFSNNTLVAHNLPFDEKFMSSELWRCGISFKPSGRLDTMSYFKDVLKIPAKTRRYGPYKNPKLQEVADYFKVDYDKAKQYCNKLFGDYNTSFHDSRFDTTIMYIIVNLQREVLNGGTVWHDTFCKRV